jgi:hypothetical protein
MKKLYIFLVAMLTFTTAAYAQIGSLSSDLVFTPVTPCRLFDTRPSQGGTGPIPAAGTKGFAVWGQASFAAQGGAATNCGVVAAANTAAVAVNLTVVLPTTAGFITAYPTGAAQPLAATVNFNAGDVKGNFAIVKVQQTGAAPSLNVYSTSTVDVVGDVVGYYSKPVATALNCTIVSGVATNIAAGAYASLPTLFCPANFTTMGLSISAGENVLVADSYTSGNAGQIFVRSLSANAQNVTAKLQCCQIPGR